MKKIVILILSLILVILTVSCVSALDNDTDIFKEQNNEIASIDENDNVSIAQNKNEDINSNLNETEDEKSLGSAEKTEILTATSSSSVLSSASATVSPQSSSNYKEPTKKQRTIKIGGFKAVLSKAQYKKFYKISDVEDYFFENGYNHYYYVGEKFEGYYISSSGLRHQITVKTNKFIKVKVKIGKKYKIKRTRAQMIICYGEGQCGVAYRFIAFLTHRYDNPGYDYAKVLGKKAKYYFSKCKHSSDFTKLNKSKLVSPYYVYKKYSLY